MSRRFSLAEAGKLVQTLTTLLFTEQPLRSLISRAPCWAANGLGTLSINGFPVMGMSKTQEETNILISKKQKSRRGGGSLYLLCIYCSPILHLQQFLQFSDRGIPCLRRASPPTSMHGRGWGVGGTRSACTQTYGSRGDCQGFTGRLIPGTGTALANNPHNQEILDI